MAHGSESLEKRISRWEDLREIKNLMGVFVNYIILNRDVEIFPDLWVKEDTVCIGFNTGWYIGQEAVCGYFEANHRRHKLVAELLQKRFPKTLHGKTLNELYGIGTFRDYPITCPIIRIAGDGKTAKGLWYCQGTHAELTSAGSISCWTWGFFAVDFMRSENGWKLWHLQFVNDVDSRCGFNWGEPIEDLPQLKEFEELQTFKMPAYTVQNVEREVYSPNRPLFGSPPIPEDYECFEQTFSYGYRQGGTPI